MIFSKLFLFLEGDDDERFFRKIFLNELEKTYCSIEIIKYAQMSKVNIRKLVKSIERKDSWDYIFINDIDMFNCFPEKKNSIMESYRLSSNQKIVVVIKEIESWYLAGIDNDFLRSINAGLMDRTSSYINKEFFNELLPNRIPRTNFMNKILENYNLQRAIQNNDSFAYFTRTFLD